MEKYNYFPVNVLHSDHQIEFKSLKDFNRFLILHKLSTIFVIDAEKGEVAQFAVSYKGGLLSQSAEGFKTMEDYQLSLHEHFPDSTSFYEATKMGYKTYADYKLVKEAGINDTTDYIAMKEKGFAEGFPEWKKSVTVTGENEKLVNSNAFEFYKYVTDLGFDTYAEFKKATESGFTSGNEYKQALSKKFDNAADYKRAIELGFDTALDFSVARKNKIRDRADFMRFNDLDLLKNTGCMHDQRVMLNLMSKLPQNKKVSINKLDELLGKALAEYNYADTGKLPEWFTLALHDRKNIVDFLNNNNAVKKYGHYDTDGEFFETKTLKSRKIVIDGSNVAFNSKGDHNAKPYIMNVIRLVQELKKKEFNDITIIVDASLRHRLEDKEKIQELRKIADYQEAPAENPADIFIIQYVKIHHCLLISNDLFREWKLSDPWVAHNIDYYRMSFMISDDSIMLPDIDKS